MMQTFVQCLMNYWTSKNPCKVGPACDWAVDMKKCYPPAYLADCNRCLIRQYEHRVTDGNSIKYLHIAKASWQQKRDGLCSKVNKTQCSISSLFLWQLWEKYWWSLTDTYYWSNYLGVTIVFQSSYVIWHFRSLQIILVV